MTYNYTIHLKNGEKIFFTREIEKETHENYVDTIEQAIVDNSVLKIGKSAVDPKWRMIPVSSVNYIDFEEK